MKVFCHDINQDDSIFSLKAVTLHNWRLKNQVFEFKNWLPKFINWNI